MKNAKMIKNLQMEPKQSVKEYDVFEALPS